MRNSGNLVQIVYMITLTRYSERIFNPIRYTGSICLAHSQVHSILAPPTTLTTLL